MKLVILSIVTGLMLFTLIGYVAIFGVPRHITQPQSGDSSDKASVPYQNNTVTRSQVLAADSENFNEQANLPESSPDYSVEKLQTQVSIYSPINLRYDGETYLLTENDLKNLMGIQINIEELRKDFYKVELSDVQKLVDSKFTKFNQKKYQSNIDGIDQDKIKGFFYYKEESGPELTQTAGKVYKLLRDRVEKNSGRQDYIKVEKVAHPGTNGEYSPNKYLELDQSAQMLYAWEDGELYNSWPVSGFYDEWAVYGVFDVKNKAPKAFSDIVDKWMPYWMAYYYSNQLSAWYGLHELVYWYDEDGNYIEEPSSSIGLKKSAGCVRLDRGEMIKLYEWSEVGMHFLIRP